MESTSEASVEQKIRDEQEKRIRRKVCQIDSSGQIGLFRSILGNEVKGEEVRGKALQVLPQFIDPNPEGILIGNQGLSEFLRQGGERDVFVIRDFLGEMDWTAFEAKSKPGGRRPYSPRGMLGLILLGVLEGRSSLRQLEKLARTDLRAMWVTGGISPDHAAIGRFIQLHEDQLTERFFTELTVQVVKRTGSPSSRGALDGTVIQAAASRYKAIQAEAAQAAALESRKQAEEQPEDQKLQRKAELAEAVHRAAQQRIVARKAQRKKNAERVRVSPTEPEAVNQPLKNGVKAPSYKPSILANEQRIITAQAVDPTSEQVVVKDLLAQARQVNGGAPLQEIMADSSYFSSTVIEQVMTAQVGSFLSPEGQSLGDGPWEKRSEKFPKTQFTYDPEKDCYHCPAGHQLIALHKGVERGKPFQIYGGAPCRDCSLRSQCTTSAQGRKVTRYHDDDIKDRIREKMRQPEARKTYSQRRGMVEPVFSYLKGRQGLTRFRRRGLQNVRLEFALHAAAYNLGRLLVIGFGASPNPEDLVRLEIVAKIWVFFFPDARSPYRPTANEIVLNGSDLARAA